MEDDNTPATKADIQRLLDAAVDALKTNARQLTDELKNDAEDHKEDLKRDFRVVVEKAHADILGAKKDQVELLKDRSEDHEQRIKRLEVTAGLAAG